ncbi:hypothetical protein [Sphingomonas sp. S2-65]|uniref:hypothetical protein n=1 Tax=Sphingomonas sp. S2-65 TaxID=2903960 RepID=UPI001F3083F8|nr:hypothetical protein [Sphingomonas sp. S2-65]UYY58007.1 hypothetical protein LZ586_15285 [Sphingomonas sp. S2-65]
MLQPLPLSRLRLYIVTFDLNQPSPGDLRYRRVDGYLRTVGAVVRPCKQTRMVVTRSNAAGLRAGIRSIIGARGDIAVFPVSRRSSMDIRDPGIRAAVRQAIARHGFP